jgi:antitoxin component YwqK of YwqJK toxin-antitoxin module
MKIASVCFALALAGVALRAGSELLDGSPPEGADEHTSYYAEDVREEWAQYLDGRRHGACKRWYRDGTLRAEGRYEHGRMEGAWTWYRQDGSVDPERSGTYRDGRRVSD